MGHMRVNHPVRWAGQAGCCGAPPGAAVVVAASWQSGWDGRGGAAVVLVAASRQSARGSRGMWRSVVVVTHRRVSKQEAWDEGLMRAGACYRVGEQAKMPGVVRVSSERWVRQGVGGRHGSWGAAPAKTTQGLQLGRWRTPP